MFHYSFSENFADELCALSMTRCSRRARPAASRCPGSVRAVPGAPRAGGMLAASWRHAVGPTARGLWLPLAAFCVCECRVSASCLTRPRLCVDVFQCCSSRALTAR